MHITQFRERSKGGATLSKAFCGEAFICDILEDEVREQLGVPVADWKIHGVTAIPSGTYEVTTQQSMRFGPATLTLLDVEGFEYIRIHGGNTVANTEGCLLPGIRNSETTVRASQFALAALRALILPALQHGETVTWEILPALMEA